MCLPPSTIVHFHSSFRLLLAHAWRYSCLARLGLNRYDGPHRTLYMCCAFSVMVHECGPRYPGHKLGPWACHSAHWPIGRVAQFVGSIVCASLAWTPRLPIRIRLPYCRLVRCSLAYLPRRPIPRLLNPTHLIFRVSQPPQVPPLLPLMHLLLAHAASLWMVRPTCPTDPPLLLAT